MLFYLSATSVALAQGANKAQKTGTTSQEIVTGTKSKQLAEPKQQTNQQIRKTELTQEKVKKNKTNKNTVSPQKQAWNKYCKAMKLVEKAQNKLDAARSALVKLRDQMVAEKLSVNTRITQSGNELTTEQAAALEKEMNNIDNKYANKISKAQMDYDNALIELERAQDSAHDAKAEYQRLGGI